MNNLRTAIAELNSMIELDGHIFDSMYDFTTEEDGEQIIIFDRNDAYHIDSAEDNYYAVCQFCDEHGLEKPVMHDSVCEKLDEAVKADFGEDAYLDWEDNVRMIVVKG